MRRGNISDVDVEGIVRALQTIDCDSAWERVLRIGQTVLDRLAGGDAAEWQSQRSGKNNSLRRIAETAGCPFRKSALSSAVGVYIFARAHEGVTKLATIKPTHVASVTGLDTDRAVVLLTEAAEKNWSVRELCSRVRTLRRAEGEKRGRPVGSPFNKVESLISKAIAGLAVALDRLESCHTRSPEDLARFTDLLDQLDESILVLRQKSGVVRHSRERAHAA